MSKHTVEYEDPTHVLRLTEDEAYQIWKLSFQKETGRAPRITSFFSQETSEAFETRFYNEDE